VVVVEDVRLALEIELRSVSDRLSSLRAWRRTTSGSSFRRESRRGGSSGEPRRRRGPTGSARASRASGTTIASRGAARSRRDPAAQAETALQTATQRSKSRRWLFQAKGKLSVNRSRSRPPMVQATSSVVTLSMKSVSGRAGEVACSRRRAGAAGPSRRSGRRARPRGTRRAADGSRPASPPRWTRCPSGRRRRGAKRTCRAGRRAPREGAEAPADAGVHMDHDRRALGRGAARPRPPGRAGRGRA
jgi:hypothetical protein